MAAVDIVVAGICNVEVSCPAEFPLEYTSTRFPTFGVDVAVSGVAFNVAAVLSSLGSRVRLATFLARDSLSGVVRTHLEGRFHSLHVTPCDETPRSIVLYDGGGRRAILADLRGLERDEVEHAAPQDVLADTSLLAAGNLNANRPLLEVARSLGMPVATDLQAVRSPVDQHNLAFLRAARFVFMSNDYFVGSEADLLDACRTENARAVVVIGMAGRGALLDDPASNERVHIPAPTDHVVGSTSGAGDALFAAFLDGVRQGMSSVPALVRAVDFASTMVAGRHQAIE